MTTAALLFGSTFVVVLALGLQSLNVNGGHRWMAVITSFAIGTSNLVLFKLLPGPTSALEIAAYLLGGPFGIVAAMALHPRLVTLLKPKTKPATSPPPSPTATPPWRRWEERAPLERRIDPLRQLALDLLSPDELGHAVTAEVRQRALRALNP